MAREFFVIEDVEKSPRRPVFTLLGVPWLATPLAWINPLLAFVLGIGAALILRPNDSLVTQLVIGLIYGVMMEIVYFLHSIGHTLSGQWVGSPMTANLITATRTVNLYQDTDPLPSRVHIGRAAGGPLINLAFAAVFGLLGLIFYSHAFQFFAAFNALWGAVALLPIASLDGAVILRELRKKQGS